MQHLKKLTFYVPDSHLEVVKLAIFAAGAGRYKDYDCCCWQVLGQGQFKPLTGATPYLGKINVLETVDEWRVEVVCAPVDVDQVIRALKQAHPYAVPAFDLIDIQMD